MGRKIFVYESRTANVNRPVVYRHQGDRGQRGLIIAVDPAAAAAYSKQYWYDPSEADVDSGVFGRICEFVKLNDVRGVWCYYLADEAGKRYLRSAFLAWADLDQLSAGRSLPAHSDAHRAMLDALAAAIAAPAPADHAEASVSTA